MSDEENKDLTRIEDLSEFIHQDDPDIDAQLDENEAEQTPDLPSIDDLEDDDDFPEVPSFDDSSEDDQEELISEFDESTQVDEEISDTFPMGSEEPDEESFESEEFSFDSTDEDLDTPDLPDFEQDETEVETESSEDFLENEESSSEELDEAPSFEINEVEAIDNEEAVFESNESDDFDEEPTEEIIDNFDNIETPPSFDSEDSPTLEETIDSDIQGEVSLSEVEAQPVSHTAQREDFSDVKEFAENITYGTVSTGGNPPFSIILSNIKFQEDVEDILIILREHGICNEENEKTYKQSLDSGNLLISQISEYCAIYLTHKFRRFDIDIKFGLSDEIHVSKSYERSEHIGLISKENMRQNKSEGAILSESSREIEDIITATTPTLENYNIVKYIDVANRSILITEEELNDQAFEDESPNDFGMNKVYRELANELKGEAIKKGGNAVVGINFQLTPLPSEGPENIKYQLNCSGNIVWIVDQYTK